MFYRAKGVFVSTVFDSMGAFYAGSSCASGLAQWSRPSWWPPIALHPVTMPWAESVLACHIVLGDCMRRPCLTERVHPAQVQVVRQALRSGRGPVGRSPPPSSSHYVLG